MSWTSFDPTLPESDEVGSSRDAVTQAESMSTPRVLFVAHEATRTGAPIMLLHFLRWIREHTDLEFEVLLLSGGAMVAEFSAVATTHLLSARGMAPVTYVEAGMVRAGLSRSADTMKLGRLRRASRNLTGYDALYLNSATSALALRFLPEIPPVVFSHVHELDSTFAYWFPEEQRNAMLSKTDWFVTCADAVSRNLVAAHGVERSRIRRHYEFINPPIAEREGSLAARRDLGIPDTAFVVGSVGQVIWRKAPDLFLQAAADLRRRRPDIDAHFVWIGGVDPRDLTPVATDLVRLGLADRMHFVGEVAAPADLLATFDVFCLTSREDPFPLVMLEAAALGVPVVSFANGGAVEFAAPDADGRPRAVIVPYLDAEAMAAAIAELADDDLERKLLGARGRDRVLAEHTVEVAAPALYEDLVAGIASTMRAGTPS